MPDPFEGRPLIHLEVVFCMKFPEDFHPEGVKAIMYDELQAHLQWHKDQGHNCFYTHLLDDMGKWNPIAVHIHEVKRKETT